MAELLSWPSRSDAQRPGRAAGEPLLQLLQTDPRTGGRVLRAVLDSDEALTLLDGYGWMDGGCVLLADALSGLLDGQPHRQVGLVAGDRGAWAQHALVEVSVRGVAWYLDGDGASTLDELLHRWRTVERLTSPVLVNLTPALVHPDTPRDPSLATRIAALLADRIAVASPARLAALDGAAATPIMATRTADRVGRTISTAAATRSAPRRRAR